MIKKMLASIVCMCVLSIQTSCFAGLMDYPNIAVINFSKKASVPEGLTFEDASMVTDYVIDALIDTDMFQVMEREELRSITNEHSYNTTGLVDLNTAAQIGRLNGVKYLVYGSVVGLGVKEKEIVYSNNKYGDIDNAQHTVVANVHARFIDVETGRIVLTGQGEGASTSSRTGIGYGITENIRTVDNGDGTTRTLDTEHNFVIGTAKVSQVQVHNALEKAVDDLVFGNRGFLKKLERKSKRRRK